MVPCRCCSCCYLRDCLRLCVCVHVAVCVCANSCCWHLLHSSFLRLTNAKGFLSTKNKAASGFHMFLLTDTNTDTSSHTHTHPDTLSATLWEKNYICHSKNVNNSWLLPLPRRIRPNTQTLLLQMMTASKGEAVARKKSGRSRSQKCSIIYFYFKTSYCFISPTQGNSEWHCLSSTYIHKYVWM